MAEHIKWPRLGLDFGSAYIKVAQVDKKGISRIVLESVPEGIFKDGDVVAVDAATVFLRDLLRKNRLKAKQCAFILPPGRVLFRQISTPVMDDRQIRKDLPFEFRDIIAGKKENYYFDYSIGGLKKNDAGEVVGLELNISAILRESMDAYLRFFRRVGLHLRIAAPRECAFSNLIRTYEANRPEHGEGGDYCFLDIGHSATRVHLYSGPLFQATRVIDYGGGMVDSAIARDLSIDLSAARAYKEDSQEATRYLKETSTAYRSIALEIRKALNFYQSERKAQQRFERLFCCGGGYWLKPLLDAIEETAGIKVLEISELLPPSVGAAETSQDVIGASAVGITLQ